MWLKPLKKLFCSSLKSDGQLTWWCLRNVQ